MYQLIWEPHGLIRKMVGRTTWQEVKAAAIEAQADPRFDDVHYVIVDMTNCSPTGETVEDDDLDEMAALASVANQRLRAGTRFALVVPDPRLRRLAERYTRSPFARRSYRIVDSLAAARDWAAAAQPA